MMSVILPDDSLRVQLPQARVVIATGRDQVRAVGAEGAVPDPPLMALETRLERETHGGLFLRKGCAFRGGAAAGHVAAGGG